MSAQRLVQWVEHHGGELHDGVSITDFEDRGRSLVADVDLAHGTEILKVPHNCSLSALNALVDDSVPILHADAGNFPLVALGVFYLMHHWINRETSFYRPYLDILPTPEEGFGTPFWFDEHDMQWLEGSDLDASFASRQELWRSYWRDGTAILEDGGMDVSLYTWDLCKWAATIFSSRSIPSRALGAGQAQDPIWTTYKHPTGSSTQVTYNWSDNASLDRWDFPVLMPLMDLLNHHPSGKVDWVFAPGQFDLNLASNITAGEEVYNNYGPKSNSELLLGYGFCIKDNPHDIVYETLKSPSPDLRSLMQSTTLAGYFRSAKPVTFGLKRWNADPDPDRIWTSFPPDLLALLNCIVLHESGLLETPEQASSSTASFSLDTSATLPRIAYTLVQSLAPKIVKLNRAAEMLTSPPSNIRQRNAQIYRDGQVEILLSLVAGLKAFTRSLRPSTASLLAQPQIGSSTLTLDQMLRLTDRLSHSQGSRLRAGLGSIFDPNGGSAGERLGSVLGGSPAEPYAWAVALCYLAILLCPELQDVDEAGTGGEREDWVLAGHIHLLAQTYGTEEFEALSDEKDEDEGDETAARVLEGIRHAAEETVVRGELESSNVWASGRWSERCILDWGLRVARSQGMPMQDEEEGGVRFVVYLHSPS